jgi:Integral membrane protein S linking to the trans Golgi network
MVALDPKLVVSQIVAMQCFYYVAMGIVLGMFKILFGTQVRVKGRYCKHLQQSLPTLVYQDHVLKHHIAPARSYMFSFCITYSFA